MNKNKTRSTAICSVQEGNKKIDNIEAQNKTSTKIGIENDSPEKSYESRVSGHSTPIRKKDYVLDVEDSPELDYRCSPIYLPCTQDGGNEVAWDWQISVGRNCNENIKAQNNTETPKRTKQLQKKRNSNSPLLQKPLKRKQVKMENIENIGKFTAELKALSERMESMQQNHENHATVKEESVEYEYKSKLLIELDNENSEDVMLDIDTKNDKSKTDIINTKRNIKKESHYEDLFDDSIDDSMVKCSQEIEEKLNLYKIKRNDAMELSVVPEEKELSSTSEKESQCLTMSNNSTGSSKNSNISKSSLSMNTSGRLKIYSNSSSKTSSVSSVSFSSSMSAKPRKSFLYDVLNVENGKPLLQDKDMSVFPNDSFDDCLATCVEDDKLLSKLSEYDFNSSGTDSNSNYSKKISKRAVSSTVNNKRTSNGFVPKTVGSSNNVKSSCLNSFMLISNDVVDDISALDHKETIQKSFISNNTLENRKFFKTKSLSDQYFHQSTSSTANGKTSKPSQMSSEKRFQSSSVNPSVSTTFPIVKGQNPYGNNKHLSTNGVGNAHTLNRLEEKESGNCILKYKSTSNLCSVRDVKQSQPVQCTREEIERKRIEARMRLEAKRKLQQNTIINTRSEVPVKKSVKR